MKPFAILAAAVVMACASAGAGSTSVDARNPNVITADQISASQQTNAYNVVSSGDYLRHAVRRRRDRHQDEIARTLS